jgi:hypothetical protein
MVNLRPEDQVLLFIARHAPDEKTNQQLRQLLHSDLDWNYLLASAERHCVMPLLQRHLAAPIAAALPAQALKQLQHANSENTNSNLFLTGELVKLLHFLQANKIQAIPFKGPTLALAAYGDIGMRQFADLDILINKRDLLKVKQLLADQGFRPHPQLGRRQEMALSRFDCAWNFVNAKNVMVDVHWNLVEPHFAFAVDSKDLCDRLQLITVAGKQFLTLSTEDLLLVLCLHGFTHFWDRLGWICDVAGLLQREKQIDWQLLIQNAERIGGRRILSLGLLLASDLLHAPLPTQILKAVNNDPTVTAIASQVKEQLFAEPSGPTGMLHELRLAIRLRERKRDRVRSFFQLLLTPRRGDWIWLPLPRALGFLYYLVRPLRLAGKYGTTLLTNRNGMFRNGPRAPAHEVDKSTF